MAINIENFSFAAFLSINNGDYFGSGFRVENEGFEFIITAKHVIFVDNRLLRHVWIKSRNYSGESYEAFDATVDLNDDNVITFQGSDIAIIILDQKKDCHVTYKGINIVTAEVTDLGVFDDVKITEKIYLLGFPSSLVTQDDFYENDRPLLRHGIVAGKNTTNNTFIIDSIAFYGVSGGPILANIDGKLTIIGIASRYVPFIIEWKNKHEKELIRHDFYNSGYAVCERLDEIITFIKSYAI